MMALVMGLVFFASAGSIAADGEAPVLPNGQDLKTEKDYSKIALAWIKRNTLEYFPGKDSSLDPVQIQFGQQFLYESCLKFADDKNALSDTELDNKTRSLFTIAGLKHPVLQAWTGRTLVKSRKYKDAEPSLASAVQEFNKGDFPLIHKITACMAYVKSLEEQRKGKSKECQQALSAIPESFAESVSKGDFGKDELSIAFRLMDEWVNDDIKGHGWKDVFKALKSRSKIDPWLMKTIEGKTEIELAWDARGGGYSGSVTKDGWKGFEEHLSKARAVLQEAWKLRPDLPEAPASMITVIMGGKNGNGETEMLWLSRAASAQLDYMPAYRKASLALMPKWGGSIRKLHELGQACLATGRFDTDVPVFLLYCLKSICTEAPPRQWRSVFAQKVVQDELDDLWQGMIDEPGRAKERNRILTQWAICKMWGGNYERAQELMSDADLTLNLNNGFAHMSITRYNNTPRERIMAELRLFTGPSKESAVKWAAAVATGSESDAVDAAKVLLGKNKDDVDVRKLILADTALMVLDDAKHSPDITDPLLFSLGNGKRNVLNFIADNGWPLDDASTSGWNALTTSLYYKKFDDAKMLLSKGADINYKNKSGEAPLHLLGRMGSLEAVTFLVENKADLESIVPPHNTTPLLATIYGNKEASALYLIDNGAGLDAADVDGDTPFHNACNMRLFSVAKHLVEKGANPGKANKNGSTLIFYAINFKQTEIVALLIEKGAELSVKNQNGDTPLHAAAMQDNPDVVSLLLEKGADRNAVNNNGRTPLALAKEKKFEYNIRLLSK